MSRTVLPIGTKFGMLKIDSKPELRKRGSGNKSFYIFKCDCGQRIGRFICNVQRGNISNKSCGCLQRRPYYCKCGTKNPNDFGGSNKSICKKCVLARRKEQIRVSPELRKRKCQHTSKSQQKNIRSFITHRIHRHEVDANKKMLAFEIDIDFIVHLWYKQNEMCALTGIKMVHTYKNLRTVSIDRIDSSKGYTKGNVQLVCKAINLGKLQHSNCEMLEFIEEIRKTHPSE